MKKLKSVFIFAAGLLIAACSPISMPQKNLYILNPGQLNLPKAGHSSRTLLVMTTQANDDIANKKMAYVNQPYQIAYFTKNAWAAEPADQLTALITQTLQQTGYFKAVVQAPFVGVTDLKLNTTLSTLQQNFLFNPAKEQLVLSAQLVNASSGKLIAGKTFSYDVSAMGNNPHAGVVAANKAVQQLLQDLTQFVLRFSYAH